jgi:hypothetical protein
VVVTFLIARDYFYSNNRVYIYTVLIVYPRTLITVPTMSLEPFQGIPRELVTEI